MSGLNPTSFDDMDEVWHEGAISACEIIRGMYGRIESDLNWRLDVSNGRRQGDLPILILS
jgi:hypothetical protein